MPLSRRSLLSLPAAVTAGALMGAAPSPAPPMPTPLPGLDQQARQRGRFYGAAIDDGILQHDATYMAHVPVECGVVVGESSFKWAALRPAANRFSFTTADRLMSYAEHHRLAVRGHNLVWHAYNPKWLDEALTHDPKSAQSLLTEHIRRVVGHFKGRLIQWDVVNEVLWPQDGKPLGLRDSLWYRAMGASYIDLAFHLCAETDPQPLRVINDFGLDYTWPDQQQKRVAMLALLMDLVHRGVPVQALGMQAHLEAGVEQLDQKVLAQFCTDVAALGLKLVITELDVRDNRQPSDIATRDAAVAAHGKAFLDAVLDCPDVIGVVTWGLSDRRSWLNDTWPRKDGLPQRPLPLDTEMNRKPLWRAMATSLANGTAA
jgi:endo-1,4-beta-xylanase